MSIKKYSSGQWVDIPYRKYGTETDTLTTLPADVIADGQSATANIIGNMNQQGTPSPSSIIMPDECGDKTANLFDVSNILPNKYITTTDVMGNSSVSSVSNYCYVYGLTQVTLSFSGNLQNTAPRSYCFYDSSKTLLETGDQYQVTVATTTFAVPSGAVYMRFTIDNGMTDVMLNTGSTALPYETYGYKIPILCGGTTTNVYLGEVESTRQIKKLVLTGQENFTARTNTSHSFQLPITRSADNSLSVSSHYKMINSNQIDVVTGFYAIGSFVLIITDLQYSDVTDFKTYLQQQYSAGTPVTVWYVLANETTGTVNEPIRKIGDHSDSVSGANLPTTGTAESFDVSTTLKPSEVSLTYHGWHEHSDTVFSE